MRPTATRLTRAAAEWTLEALDRFVERLRAPSWLAIAVVGSVVLAGSTVVWVGAGDVIALVGASGVGCGGVTAAWWRRRLDALPLEVANVVADDGEALTVRGWLGRGRRIDGLEVEVEVEGVQGPVESWVPAGPVVGRFHVRIARCEGPFEVRIRAEREGRRFEVTRRYEAEDRRVGRFAAGIRLGRRATWVREDWARVEVGEI